MAVAHVDHCNGPEMCTVASPCPGNVEQRGEEWWKRSTLL